MASEIAPSRCTWPNPASVVAGISPSKKSNPCAMPVSFLNTKAETTPPVA